MDAIFFLGRRQLESYSLTEIKHREKYQLIAILFEKEIPLLSNEIKSRFNHIYGLPQKTDDLLAEFSPQEVLTLIQKYIQQKKPNRVSILCQDEGNVLVAGMVREQLQLPSGPRLSELEIFKNKILMKQCMEKNKIRIPHYLHFDRSYSYTELTNLLGTPFIVKPISSAGSLGIYKISSSVQYAQFTHEQQPYLSAYEAEEFIHGTLYHCDTVAKDKHLLFLECAIYSCPNLDFQFGKPLGSMAMSHDHPLFQPISLFAKKALSALGMPDGCHHMEVFVTSKNEIVFLEIGARSPGLIAPIMYEKTTGINILDKDLEAQSNIEFIKKNSVHTPCFWMIFPLQEGVIKELIPPQLESVYEITWTVKTGQKTKASKSNGDFGAILIATNQNRKILERDFIKISNTKVIVY